MRRILISSLALATAALLSTLACAGAASASITVELRVEGSTSTLFEGPIAVEVPAAPGLETPSSGGPHMCNFKDNGAHEEFGPSAVTPTAAVAAGARAAGLSFDATWSAGLSDFEITQIGPDTNDETTGSYWGYAVNYTTAEVGGCQFALAPGSEVLWAYNYFGLPHLLDLTGPSTAAVGVPFTVHVSDGQSGAPIAGATVGQDVAGTTTPLAGASTTDAAGNATVTLSAAGTSTLKATAPESVRSNGLVVCTHNGADGTCGAPGPQQLPPAGQSMQPPPAGTAVVSLKGGLAGRSYSARNAPRVLGGAVTVPAGATLRDVRISLRRRVGKRCWVFSNARGAFVRARCGKASFFSVGDSLSFSYLLPHRLPRGWYTFAIEAVEASGRIPVSGVKRAAFRVR